MHFGPSYLGVSDSDLIVRFAQLRYRLHFEFRSWFEASYRACIGGTLMAFSTAEFDREGEKVDLVDHEILNWSVNSLEEFSGPVIHVLIHDFSA